MKVVAIIQARMRSTRLPGKVMKTLRGRTVLAHVVARVGAARRVTAVMVATSDLAVDDEVAREAARTGALVSRGSETDVLGRYYHAARSCAADVIVRVTSDCPLFDPELLDRMLAEFLTALTGDDPYDYYSNTLGDRTYPTGLDAEIFTMAALTRAFDEGRRPFEREHVTPYLYQHPDLFHLGGMTAETDHSEYRWTLDTPADLELITRIYDALYQADRLITTAEILALMNARPELPRLNSHVQAKGVTTAVNSSGGLVIRADGSEAIGAGHLLRCLALAQAWPPAAGPVCFLMAEGAEVFAPRLEMEGFVVETLDAAIGTAADAAATVGIASARGATWIVADGYRFDNAYLDILAQSPSRVLFLDDCGRADLPAVDLLLNQNLQATPDLYPGVSPATRLLLGVGHVLLRREFLTTAASDTEPTPDGHRLLVTLGGGDPDNISQRVMAALEQVTAADLQARVLVAADSPHLAALEAQVTAGRVRIDILTDVTDMPVQYRWANLAVTAGGGTLWELAFSGVPALTMAVADNQEPASRLLADLGAVRYLGRPADLGPSDLAEAIQRVVDDPDARAEMIAAGRNLIDGQGSRRVVKAMLEYPASEVTV